MKTSIVILTHNQLDYTKLCIESIRRYTNENSYEIIVVDNASTDDTPNWLSKQSDITVIQNDINMGFPKGCNQGIEVSTGEFIMLLNNDVVVTENWLSNLITCLTSSPIVGAVSCVTNSSSYGQQISVSYNDLKEMDTFASSFNKSNPQLWEERMKLVGFCYLIKKEVIEKVGLLDEQFSPGNFEDDDYSIRIFKAGYQLFLCRDTFIHHFGGTSFRKNIDQYLELLKVNERKFVEKWGFDPEDLIINYNLVEQLQNMCPAEKEFKILYVGCRAGATLQQIKSKLPQVDLYGLDTNEKALNLAGAFAYTKVTTNYQADFDYPLHFFDVIIVDKTLHQVIDLELMFEKFENFLGYSGRLILTVSNAMYINNLTNLLNGRWNVIENNNILKKSYVNFFTFFDIKDRIVKNEFEIESLLKFVSSNENSPKSEILLELIDINLRSEASVEEYIIISKKSKIAEAIKKYENEDINALRFYESIKTYSDEYLMYFIDLTRNINDKFNLYNSIGVIFFEQGEYERVIPFLKQALNLKPLDKEALFNFSYFLMTLGERNLASEYLANLREVDTDLFNKLIEIAYAPLFEFCMSTELLPLVSLVIRTKDRKQLLNRTLKSVDIQIYPNIEIVIVNDGGQDVKEVIEELNLKCPVKYISNEESLGRATALDQGLSLASGEYINFLDDDDLIYPFHVALLVQTLENNKHFGAAYTDAMLRVEKSNGADWEIIERRKEHSQGYDPQLLLYTNYLPNLTVMFKRDLLQSLGGINTSYQVLEDWDFWIRMSKLTDFYHLHEVSSEYSQRVDSDNATQKEGDLFTNIRDQIYKKNNISF